MTHTQCDQMPYNAMLKQYGEPKATTDSGIIASSCRRTANSTPMS